MISLDRRLLAMFIGWVMALYGVHRRDWAGTITAMTGIGLAGGAMVVGEGREGCD